jgi:hypothetical protein
MLTCVRVAASSLLAAALLGTACSGDTLLSFGETRNLLQGEARWTASPARNAYRYEVRQVCFCPVELSRWTVVEVRDGVVVSARTLTGQELPPEWRESFPTVERLFSFLRPADRRDLEQMEAEFDQRHGYPTFISLGYNPRIADAGLTVYARNLVAIPAP